MNLQIEFAPLLSWPILAVFAAICVAAIIFMLWQRRRGTLFRAATSALLLATLANPIIRQDEREPLTDIAVAIIDQRDRKRHV